MKLTIAFDDISLPLPPMRRPDVRQRVIEAVLDVAAAAGVDDVHLIAALALHRRMTEAELRHAVGDRVYDAFAPHGLLYNHDAEDPDGMAFIGETSQGRGGGDQQAGRHERPDRLREHQPRVDGRRLEVHRHRPGLLQVAPPPPQRRDDAALPQLHGPPQERAPLARTGAWARCSRTAASRSSRSRRRSNNDTFGTSGPMSVLQKREWEWTARDRATFIGMKAGLDRMPIKARRKIFNSWLAPYGITSVQAGEVEAVHEVTTENVFKQQLVAIEGQTDILTMGLPYICPYNVNSIMNPILVMCLGLGYFFNMYRGQPLVREGGVLIMSHPTPWEFHPVHHPSYIDFFEQVLADTTDPVEIEQRYEKQYAEDEWYRHLYRTSYAYHGVHPFYMWYWGSHGLAHLGKVIIVGGEPRSVRRLGFTAGLDAQRRARDGRRRRRPRRHHHPPPQPPDRDGRRHVKVPRLAKPPVPVLGAHGARRGRAAAPSRNARRRLRHRLGPPVPGPLRPHGAARGGAAPGGRRPRRARARRHRPPRRARATGR